MSTFSPFGAFATFAAYQRIGGSQEASSIYQEIYHSSNTTKDNNRLPLLIRIAQYISSIILSAAVGGYIVGIHGHIQPYDNDRVLLGSRLPETISMLWLIAMTLIALFGTGRIPGLALFATAWNDMVDWLHEQAKDGD